MTRTEDNQAAAGSAKGAPAAATPEERAAAILKDCSVWAYEWKDGEWDDTIPKKIALASIKRALEDSSDLLRESEQREQHWKGEFLSRRAELAKLNRKVSGLLQTLERERAGRAAPEVEAVALLREIQWKATAFDRNGDGRDGCPSCGGIDPSEPVAAGERGHRSECRLAALLTRAPAAREEKPAADDHTSSDEPWSPGDE